MQGLALEQGTCEDAGEEVACAAGAEGDAVDGTFVERRRLGVVADDGNRFVARGDTGDDDLTRSHGGQLLAEFEHSLHGWRALGIGDVGQQGSFGIIRCNDGRFCDELAHFHDNIGLEDRVELAVIGHGRIDDDEGILLGEAGDGVEDDGDLAGVGEEAAVNGVIRIAQFLPFIHEFRHVRRKIREGIVAIRQVVAENSRREGADLEAHGRNDRDGGCQGAAAERTHIVDCEDAFSCHRKNLLKVNCTIILSHDVGHVNKTDCGDSVLPADSRRDINAGT